MAKRLDGYFQNIQYFYDNLEEIKNLILDDDYIDSIKKKVWTYYHFLRFSKR